MKKILINLLCFLWFCSSSCTEKIDIDTAAAEEHLVIYGYITDLPGEYRIHISRSAPFFSENPPEGISGAQVVVSHKDTTYVFLESEEAPGLYLSPIGLTGKEGEAYELTVELDFDRDGVQESYAAQTYMPYSSRVDSIQLKPSTDMDDRIELLLYGMIADNEENYFSMHLFRNGEGLNDSLMHFSLLDGEYLLAKEIKGAMISMLDQDEEREKLTPGDRLVFRLNNITKDYYTFLSTAQSEVRGNMPIFSGPPANVKTNIRQISGISATPIVGFFTAYSGREAGVIVKQEDTLE